MYDDKSTLQMSLSRQLCVMVNIDAHDEARPNSPCIPFAMYPRWSIARPTCSSYRYTGPRSEDGHDTDAHVLCFVPNAMCLRESSLCKTQHMPNQHVVACRV